MALIRFKNGVQQPIAKWENAWAYQKEQRRKRKIKQNNLKQARYANKSKRHREDD